MSGEEAVNNEKWIADGGAPAAPSQALWEVMLMEDPEAALACARAALRAVGESSSLRAEAIAVGGLALAKLDNGAGVCEAGRFLRLALSGRLAEAIEVASKFKEALAILHENMELHDASSFFECVGARRAMDLEIAAPGFLGGKERALRYCEFLPELAAAMRMEGSLSSAELLGLAKKAGSTGSPPDQRLFFKTLQTLDPCFMPEVWRAFWEQASGDGEGGSGEWREGGNDGYWMGCSNAPNPWAALDQAGGMREIDPELALSMARKNISVKGAGLGFARYAAQWGAQPALASALRNEASRLTLDDEGDCALCRLAPANQSAEILCVTTGSSLNHGQFAEMAAAMASQGFEPPRFIVEALEDSEWKIDEFDSTSEDNMLLVSKCVGLEVCAGILAFCDGRQESLEAEGWLMSGALKGDISLSRTAVEMHARAESSAEQLACAEWVLMSLEARADLSRKDFGAKKPSARL